MSEDEVMAAGARVSAILNNEDFKTAVEKVQRKNFEQFCDADGVPEVLTAVWAKQQALKDLLQSLNGTVQAGKFAEGSKKQKGR